MNWNLYKTYRLLFGFGALTGLFKLPHSLLLVNGIGGAIGHSFVAAIVTVLAKDTSASTVVRPDTTVTGVP